MVESTQSIEYPSWLLYLANIRQMGERQPLELAFFAVSTTKAVSGKIIIQKSARFTWAGFGLSLALSWTWAGPALAGDIGTPLTPEMTIVTPEYSVYGTSVARDAAGNFAVLWLPVGATGEAGPLTVQRFATDGTPLTAAIPVATTGGPIHALGMDAAGDFVVAWNCNSSATICAQVFAPNGTSPTGVITVEPPQSQAQLEEIYSVSVVMNASGDFVVSWCGDAQYGTTPIYSLDKFTTEFVRTRRYRVNGTPYGAARDVAFGAYPLVRGGYFENSQIAMGSSGNYAVLWYSRYQETNYVRFYSAQGAALTKAVVFPAPIDAVAIAPNGDLLTTYIGPESPGTVYYQRFSSLGAAKGNPVPVSSLTSGFYVHGLSINATSASGAMITWGDYGTASVYARAYSANDVALSDAFIVSSYPDATSNLNLSTVLDTSDNLLAIWGNVNAELFQGP